MSTISTEAVVCQDAELIGDVTIGARTVVHPKAIVNAKGGPIIIGEDNVLEEQIEIVNNSAEPMVIGSFNLFEVRCCVQAQKVRAWFCWESNADSYADSDGRL
jgi:dynactin-6